MKIMKKLALVIISLFFCLLSSMPVFAHGYAMSYLYGGTTTQYMNYVKTSDEVLNSVSPDYFELYSDGSLNYQKIDPQFVQNMHSQNRQVVPFLSNHWDRTLGITALDNTEGLTSQIAQAVSNYNLDGINVDIENVSHLHRNAYSNFVKRLRDKMPDKIITVAVAANPNNWQTGWHGSYDYAELAKYSDYLMIMGYDESYSGGPAGPVSSASFAEKSILYALKYTTADKLVLGIPFFGRYWKEGEAVGGQGITSMDIENLIQNYETTKVYHTDSRSAQLTLRLYEGETMPKLWGGRTLTPGVYDIWYDDIASTEYKLQLVNKYSLKGSGSWALGQENSNIWSMYANYKTQTSQQQNTPSILYSSHLQDLGWESDYSRKDGAVSGTTGQSKRMEAVKILLKDAPAGASLSYQMHVQNLGWVDWKTTGTVAGTTGRGLRGECIRIKLNNMPGYHVEYRVHVQNLGWLNWVRNGQEAGTTGRSLRLEAIQIRLVADGSASVNFTAAREDSDTNVIDKGWISAQEYSANIIVTRAEAVKVIMRMATLLPGPDQTVADFADTAAHPDRAFIRKAQYYGLINSDSSNKFYPDDPITREDLVVLIDRVFSYPDTVDFENSRASDITKTGDGEGYYAINKYLHHEIITVDDDGRFYPDNTLTMHELADIIGRMDGAGMKDLVPIQYPGQKQTQKIIEPR